MKKYRVTIGLDAFEIVVSANNKAEAKRKAIERLQRKKITSLIRNTWAIAYRTIATLTSW